MAGHTSEAIKMAESLGIWWSRTSRLRGGLLARFKEVYDKRVVVWPWADKVLMLLSFIIVLVRSYGLPPYTLIVTMAFPLFLLITVLRNPLLTLPLPTMSGFFGMVISYPALSFWNFIAQFLYLPQVTSGSSLLLLFFFT
jgi:hypothetical protein